MKSKDIVLIVLCLAVAVTFSGCVEDDVPADTTGDVGGNLTDCNAADDPGSCMDVSLASCAPATLTGGMFDEVTIGGLDGGNCTVTIKGDGNVATCTLPEEAYSLGDVAVFLNPAYCAW